MDNFSSRLIVWYEENGRDLPWRQTRDPYKIWISEVILQQTRVAQGYEYYLKFIHRFPDFQTLAAADEDEVMRYWQGLGYYSRARNLHEAARTLNQLGYFPETYKEVKALKGVGDYTAAAICSFAYGLPYAVVDGNVYRVLSRHYAIEEPIDSTEGKKMFAALAQDVMSKDFPAIYNQAIMDLGALICTPVSPRCEDCPLVDTCLAYHKQQTVAFPVKKMKVKVTDRFFHYIYIYNSTSTFIRKRQEDDIWRNLYDLPLVETKEGMSEIDFLNSDEFIAFKKATGLDMFSVEVEQLVREVKHILSHQRIHASFYGIRVPDNFETLLGYQLVDIAELHNFPVSRLINQFFSVFLGTK